MPCWLKVWFCVLSAASSFQRYERRAGAERGLRHGERGDAAVGVKGISVPLIALDGERHVVHVLPLTSGARRPGWRHLRGRRRRVCTQQRWNRHRRSRSSAALQTDTDRAARAARIVQGGGAPEVAEALGIAESTVKTHQLRLFAKTSTSARPTWSSSWQTMASPLIS